MGNKYKVKRSGGKLPAILKDTFDTYDQARNAIRKWLRVQVEKAGWAPNNAYRSTVEWNNRTINIGKFGFSVCKM